MKSSLSTKVALTIFILVASGGSLTAYLVYRSSTSALQTSISSSQASEAKQTIDKIDRFLYERTVDMRSIAGRQQIQDFLAAPPSGRSPATATALARQMDDFKISSGTWSELTIVDAQGNQPLYSNLQDLQTALTKQPSILKLYANALAGQAGYSDALIILKGHQPIMLFMEPVHDQRAAGRPIVGVLVGEIAWQATLDIIRASQSKQVTLINDKGLSLGDNQADAENDVLSKNYSQSPVFKAALKANSGAGVFPGLEKPETSFVAAYVREGGFLQYHGNNWTLVLATPKSVAFAPATQLAKSLIITFGGILILSVLVLLAFLRVLVLKPIKDLTEATSRLSRGDFSLRTTIKSNDELGSLGEDFNYMADKMQMAYKSLKDSTVAAQNDKSTMETLLENLPVGVLVVEAPSGKPIMMNRVAEQISGHSATTMAQLNSFAGVYNIVKQNGTPYPEAERPLTIALKTGKSVLKNDTYIKRPNGEVVAVRTVASPIKLANGGFKTVVSVFEDISEQRNLERSREEFFSIASHELRTPLTAIRGNTALIQDYFWSEMPNEDVKEMINDIHESSTRLISIVNDFLDTSRLEQERMNFSFEAIDMVDIAESIIKEYVVTGSRQKIHLQIHKPETLLPKVLADRNRTKQVLINLVGNALKFTDEGSVTISFKTEDKAVKTLVSDTGKGIAPESQRFLFKKFEQSGTTVLTRDSVRGTGLGLYISKLIIEQMGGHIALESSQLGVGTTFGFSLPITKSPLVQRPTSLAGPLQAKAISVPSV